MPELERELREVGRRLAFPPEPDLLPAVSRRLEERLRPRFARRRTLLVALAALAVAIAAAFAVPPARTAILRFFHIGGETVERVETLPPAERRSPVAGLDGPLTRRQAERKAGFALALPARNVAAPLRFYADDWIAATFLRLPDRRLASLTEFRGDLGIVKKLTPPGTKIEPTTVNDSDALWLEGAPHVVSYFDSNARGHTRLTRLAGNVLVWTRGGVTLRLEGRLTKSEALRIARTAG
jgi:hypothetical protein